MATATFFHEALDKQDSLVNLSASESAHAVKSRRLINGSPVQLINGRGLLAHGVLLVTSNREVSVQIESIQENLKPRSISIATAIPKGDRQRTMVDMLTQLGVSKIIPLQCERSVTKYKPTINEKWHRLAIEACKQSQNTWVPEIKNEMRIEELLSSEDMVMIADGLGQPIYNYKDKLLESEKSLLLLVGPEGGFSENELKILEQSPCMPVNLSDNILRTELACVTALAQLRHII